MNFMSLETKQASTVTISICIFCMASHHNVSFNVKTARKPQFRISIVYRMTHFSLCLTKIVKVKRRLINDFK